MRHVIAGIVLLLIAAPGCRCGPEPEPDAGVDAGEFLARPAGDTRPLFDPAVGGLDRDVANLISVWQTVPATEAEAQQQVRELRASRAALVASGAAGADRISQVCELVRADHQEHQLLCLRLLSFTESPRSLALLANRARTPLPTNEGELALPSAQAMTRQAAMFSLTRRAADGSAPALEVLLTLAAEPDDRIKSLAVTGVFDALPRWRAKSKLRAVLPESEHWRLYQSR